MNNFYEILDLLYRVNKKYPELTFGQLLDYLHLKEEELYKFSDEEFIKRLEEILKDE